MKRFTLFFAIMVSFCAISVIQSCSTEDADVSKFTIFELSKSEIYLCTGDTEQIEVMTDYEGSLDGLVNYSVATSSNNPSAVEVSATGLVTALEPGDATLVVSSTDGFFTKIVAVSVTDEPTLVTSISIDNSRIVVGQEGTKSLTLYTSESSFTFDVTINPDDSFVRSGTTWSIESNTTEATFTNPALSTLTIGSATGTFTVVATLVDTATGGTTHTDRVEVTISEDMLALDPSNQTTLTYGSTGNTLSAILSSVSLGESDVEWSSSNTSVVAFDGASSGVLSVNLSVVGVGKSTVTVKAGTLTATCEVEVIYADVESVEITSSPANNYIESGSSFTFAAAVSGSYADQGVKWTISDQGTTNATITEAGLFSSGSTKGSVKVKVESTADANKYAEVTIEVNVAVTSIAFNKSTLALAAGETETLTLVFTPADPTTQSVVWSSLDSSTASVDQTGKVTAVAEGTTTIKATSTDGGYVAECTVVVSSQIIGVASVAIDNKPSITEYYYGIVSGFTLAATITGENGETPTNSTIKWSSSNESVATVADGVVSFVGYSSEAVTITAYSEQDDTKYDTFTFIVSKIAVTSITVSDVTILVGDIYTPTSSVAPSNATNPGVTYSLTSGSSVEMLSNGTYRAVATGVSVITVTADDDSSISSTITITVASGTGVPDLEYGDDLF